MPSCSNALPNISSWVSSHQLMFWRLFWRRCRPSLNESLQFLPFWRKRNREEWRNRGLPQGLRVQHPRRGRAQHLTIQVARTTRRTTTAPADSRVPIYSVWRHLHRLQPVGRSRKTRHLSTFLLTSLPPLPHRPTALAPPLRQSTTSKSIFKLLLNCCCWNRSFVFNLLFVCLLFSLSDSLAKTTASSLRTTCCRSEWNPSSVRISAALPFISAIKRRSPSRWRLSPASLFYPFSLYWFFFCACGFCVFFKGFSSSIGSPGDLASKLVVQVKPVDTTVDAGAQIQQLVNVECVDEFVGEFWSFLALFLC